MRNFLNKKSKIIETKYIDNTDDCLLSIFSKVIDTQAYELLLIEGEHNEEKAMDAWWRLHDEFTELLKNKSSSISFELIKLIEVKKCDYKRINDLVFQIETVHKINLLNSLDTNEFEINIDDLIKEINEKGFRFNKDKGIFKEAERIRKQSKNLISQIKIQSEKLEKITSKSKASTFGKTIEMVMRDRKLSFDKDATVKDFVIAYNVMIEIQQQQNTNK